MQTEQIEVELSKIKIFLIAVGSLLFVALGIYLAFYHTNTSMRYSDSFVKFVGILSIAFCSLTLIASLFKIFDSKKGLIISDKGIFENSSFVGLGLIEWEDILEIEIKKVKDQRFFMIYLKNNDKYIERRKGFKKKVASINYRMYGSPVAISPNGLKISFKDLDNLLKTSFIKYKKSTNQ